MLILDGGGLSRLASRTKTSVSLIRAFAKLELWPPVVPTMVLVESLHGDPRRDANIDRFLKLCIIAPNVSESTAKRAAELRRRASTGSAVDALVVAMADRAEQCSPAIGPTSRRSPLTPTGLRSNSSETQSSWRRSGVGALA